MIIQVKVVGGRIHFANSEAGWRKRILLFEPLATVANWVQEKVGAGKWWDLTTDITDWNQTFKLTNVNASQENLEYTCTPEIGMEDTFLAGVRRLAVCKQTIVELFECVPQQLTPILAQSDTDHGLCVGEEGYELGSSALSSSELASPLSPVGAYDLGNRILKALTTDCLDIRVDLLGDSNVLVYADLPEGTSNDIGRARSGETLPLVQLMISPWRIINYCGSQVISLTTNIDEDLRNRLGCADTSLVESMLDDLDSELESIKATVSSLAEDLDNITDPSYIKGELGND